MIKQTTPKRIGQRRSLRIEALDPRFTMDGTASASAAIPWLNLSELSYSFVPDGTPFADNTNYQSSLFAVLASTGSSEVWQAAFEQAFSEWLNPLAAHASEVNDEGQPFGSFGPTQGDSRFGDIRIGAVPLSNNVMAEAIPNSVISQGTWAGDILLNSNAQWHDLQQVLSVALHEIGHVLGVEHSSDPASPMYFHGASAATKPTSNDISELRKLYAGVEVNGDSDGGNEALNSTWRERPKFRFDVTKAIPLPAILGTTVRYASAGALTATSNALVYQLEAVGEIDHAEYLNVVVNASQQDGLIADLAVYDHSGDPLPFRVLSNSNGTKAIQVRDVEPNQSYYIAVTPVAGPARYQVGSFEIFAAYAQKALLPTPIATVALDALTPIAEQSFSVSTSRLVHLLVASRLTSRSTASGSTAVWATLVDATDKVLAQVAMSPSDTRSAPLVMLPPGDYRVIFESGTRNGEIASVSLNVFLDEISIDVGIGAVDPATQPVLVCGSPGADPTTCAPLPPIIYAGGPIYPNPQSLPPAPTYPSIPPWTNPSWYYWPTRSVPISSSPLQSIPTYRQNLTNPLDASGDRMVSPLDALLIINLLNSNSNSPTLAATAFYDTSGDGVVSPIDALLVINALNLGVADVEQSNFAAGEGEGSVTAMPKRKWHHAVTVNNMDRLNVQRRNSW